MKFSTEELLLAAAVRDLAFVYRNDAGKDLNAEEWEAHRAKDIRPFIRKAYEDLAGVAKEIREIQGQ